MNSGRSDIRARAIRLANDEMQLMTERGIESPREREIERAPQSQTGACVQTMFLEYLSSCLWYGVVWYGMVTVLSCSPEASSC